jgi:hypothetical protein
MAQVPRALPADLFIRFDLLLLGRHWVDTTQRPSNLGQLTLSYNYPHRRLADRARSFSPNLGRIRTWSAWGSSSPPTGTEHLPSHTNEKGSARTQPGGVVKFWESTYNVL